MLSRLNIRLAVIRRTMTLTIDQTCRLYNHCNTRCVRYDTTHNIRYNTTIIEEMLQCFTFLKRFVITVRNANASKLFKFLSCCDISFLVKKCVNAHKFIFDRSAFECVSAKVYVAAMAVMA